jgi:hypothetical protein
VLQRAGNNLQKEKVQIRSFSSRMPVAKEQMGLEEGEAWINQPRQAKMRLPKSIIVRCASYRINV